MKETNPLKAAPEVKAALLPLDRKIHLLAYRGSIAHGMYVPSSEPESIDDVDLMAIYSGSLKHYLGLGEQDTIERFVEHFDLVAYELKKFFSLLLKCNPNVLGLLWQEEDKYLLLDKTGRMLIDNRELFSSKAAYHSFSGYAYGQLKRMNAYKDNGEEACCTGEEFHQPECPLSKEKGRGRMKKFATGFMGAKRKKLVETFGFDTKNAAHCLRLLTMGIEFLQTGQLKVDRSSIDAEWLLSVKTGKVPLNEVMAMADSLFLSLTEAERNSPLPERPNEKKVEELLMDCLSLNLNTEVAFRQSDLLKKGLNN